MKEGDRGRMHVDGKGRKQRCRGEEGSEEEHVLALCLPRAAGAPTLRTLHDLMLL